MTEKKEEGRERGRKKRRERGERETAREDRDTYINSEKREGIKLVEGKVRFRSSKLHSKNVRGGGIIPVCTSMNKRKQEEREERRNKESKQIQKKEQQRRERGMGERKAVPDVCSCSIWFHDINCRLHACILQTTMSGHSLSPSLFAISLLLPPVFANIALRIECCSQFCMEAC